MTEHSPAAPHDTPFVIRRWAKPEDLNAHGTFFGGRLLSWIDEEAAIYAILQLGNPRLVTKFISEIDFESSAVQGDLIELGLTVTRFGRSSITIRAEVHNTITRKRILTLDKIVFVGLDENGAPVPHGYTTVTDSYERLPRG